MKINYLRIIGIVSTTIIVSVFFVTAEIYKEEINKNSQIADLENPFLPYAGLFLFGLPPSVACIVISFLNSTKSKIIAFSSIVAASVIVIFIIAFLMLEYPSIFGIPESYWES
ncbi:hypothetical protein [Nitrosopumilus adriaticus]|uniref:hypothetical protein n=1 Tax=Nitrosopumilus adriaticus TaxID=1580092 RepID=UPI00352E3A41